MSRFHLVAPANAQTTAEDALDGFGQYLIRFAQMLMDLGHTVFLYGGEDNEAPCTEFIPCLAKAHRDVLLGTCPYQAATADTHGELWGVHNTRVIVEIAARKQPHDTLCLLGGHRAIAVAHRDLLVVEPMVGYIEPVAPFRVFTSNAWRHAHYGVHADGRFFDTVIPVGFDPDAYPFQVTKEPFALYVGRLTARKGIGIACQAAAAAGVPLYVIGHGDLSLVTHDATYLGALSTAERNTWMARASALLCPTQYLEPFGAVVVEAALCGTPAITTDFGAFTETVVHGVTGFRCNYLGEFVQALHGAQTLNPHLIRQHAAGLYSLATVAAQYQRYFDRLTLLWTTGWNTPAPAVVVEA